MYDWSDVQSIVTQSLPGDALRRLRVLEGDIQQDLQRRTAFLNRMRDRIDGLAKVIGEDPMPTPPVSNGLHEAIDRISNGGPLTLRDKAIKVMLENPTPMTPKEVSKLIPGEEYNPVWKVFVKPNKGITPLNEEPYVKTFGEERSRRYMIPPSEYE